MKKIEERRAYPRLKAYHLAKYHLVSTPEEKKDLLLSSIKDISAGGVCLRLEERLPVSSIIQLYINFPGLPQPIPTLAKIVWIKKIGKSNRYETGVHFLDIAEFSRREIMQRVVLSIKSLEGKRR